MKILVLNGSPHVNGNTAAILQKIKNGAESEGARTELINLNKLKMKGCQGCNGCQQATSTGECVMQDDMKPLYEEIYNAKAIVLGSSIYMGQMTSQTKNFFDRLFPIIRPDFTSRINNKTTALVFAHGQQDETLYKNYIKETAATFQMMGFSVIDTIIANGMYAPGMAADNTVLMQRAFDLGKKLS